MAGHESSVLPDPDAAFYEQEYLALCRRLLEAAETSLLPEEPAGRDSLNDLLIRLRLESL